MYTKVGAAGSRLKVTVATAGTGRSGGGGRKGEEDIIGDWGQGRGRGNGWVPWDGEEDLLRGEEVDASTL